MNLVEDLKLQQINRKVVYMYTDQEELMLRNKIAKLEEEIKN